MRPDDWPRIKELFMAAIALDRHARAAYLSDACDDPALRAEVQALLESHEQSDVLIDTPAADLLVMPAAANLAGRRIGTYAIEALIGRGGMGEVYRAHDSKLDRPVALKLLPAAGAADPLRLRRFHAEALAASSLNHPHILVIHDFGEMEGRPFIVTELVEGQTLRARLQQGPIPTADALDIAEQIASALAAAHAKGLVHRDVKPENVMLRADGYVKVLDFGLAKLQPSAAGAGGDLRNQTSPGAVVGTPRYMSPEQARGFDVDARTDVWSLGVVLYEMLTGTPPFDGPSVNDAIAAVLTRDAAPLVSSSIPSSVARLVDRALAKNPAQRFETAAEFNDALAAARFGPVPRLPFKQWAAVAGVVAVIGAGTIALVREWPATGAPPARPDAALALPRTEISRGNGEKGRGSSLSAGWTVKALAGPAPRTEIGFWASEVVGRFGCGNSITYVLPADVTIDATHSMHMSASEPHASLSVDVSVVDGAVVVDVDGRIPANAQPCTGDGRSFYSMLTTLEITTARPGVVTVRHDMGRNDPFRAEVVRFATRRSLDDMIVSSNWTMQQPGTVWAVLQLANDDGQGHFSDQNTIGRLYTITFQPETAGGRSEHPPR